MDKYYEKMIDLVFEKHCQMKEVSYHQDKLVCDDLNKLKEELKEIVQLIIEQIKSNK